MDFSDGEVRYKTSIRVTEDELTTSMVQPLVYLNVVTMDRYLQGIMKVAYGNVSPADAITEIEG
jgi:hypothetical protein